MAGLMRCLYCGLLQDEPSGVKTCGRCVLLFNEFVTMQLFSENVTPWTNR